MDQQKLRVADLFRRFDGNHDGMLTRDEFMKGLKASGKGGGREREGGRTDRMEEGRTERIEGVCVCVHACTWHVCVCIHTCMHMACVCVCIHACTWHVCVGSG